jgi:hypothetical protein
MSIKTVEFEYEGINVFATGVYLPYQGTVSDIEYEVDTEIEIDDDMHTNILYNATTLLESSIDTLDEISF